LVRSVTEGTVFQTTFWADYLTSSGLGKPFYFIAREGVQWRGIVLLWVEQLTGRTRPDNNLIKCFEKTAKLLRLAYGCWMHGPLVFDESRRPEISEFLLREIDRFARKEGLIFVRNIGEPIFYSAGHPGQGGHRQYEKCGFIKMQKSTLFIDLSKGPDAIWENLKKYTRKDVKSCGKHDITVHFLREGELDAYHSLMIENMNRVKAELPPHYPDKHMWNSLRTDKGRHLEVLAAKKGDEMMGAVGILEYNGIIFQIASCQSDDSYRKKINVNDLMTWEIVRWGADNKKRFYDLTGIPVNPANKKEEGLLNFKMKWSDRAVSYNAYEKTSRRFVRKAIGLLKKIA